MVNLSLQFCIAVLLMTSIVFTPLCSAADHVGVVNLGDWTQAKIEAILLQSAGVSTPGQKVGLISSAFLNTPYLAGTMVGRVDLSERLVIRFDGVDCFTLLDYVEALRRSDSFATFKGQLSSVRYQDGHIGYLTRNHFFTDWAQNNSDYLQDVTQQVGGVLIESVDKTLNLKKNGDNFLDGVPTIERRINYIPADRINSDVTNRLQVGDYIGIYSPAVGLDVSHTGIIVEHHGAIFLRHASSLKAIHKVVDMELLPYLKGNNGIIVLRPQ